MLELISYNNKELILHENGTIVSENSVIYKEICTFLRGYSVCDNVMEAIDLYNINPQRALTAITNIRLYDMKLHSAMVYFADYVNGKTDTDYSYVYNACPHNEYVELLHIYTSMWYSQVLERLEPQFYPRLEQFFSEGQHLYYMNDLNTIRATTHNFADYQLKTNVPYQETHIELSNGYMVYIPQQYTIGTNMFFYNNDDMLMDSRYLTSDGLNIKGEYNADDIRKICDFIKKQKQREGL